MSKPTNYYAIGLFVIIAIVVLVILIIIFSNVNFANAIYAETYFNESVQGLSVGSSVKLRGVDIGIVDKISFVNKVYPLSPADLHQYAGTVYVQMKLDPKELPMSKNFKTAIPAAVQNGLRIRPTPLGLTGNIYLEASYIVAPNTPVPALPWKSKDYYIPSEPSTFKQVTQVIQDISTTFKKADIKDLVTNAGNLASTATSTLKKAQIGKVSDATLKTLKNINTLAWRINTFLSSNQQSLSNAIQNLSALTDNLESTLAKNPSEFIFTAPPHSPIPAMEK